MPFFADKFHAADFDAADDGSARGTRGDQFPFGFILFSLPPFGDVGCGSEDFLAGDGRRFVLAGRKEGDVVAEAGGVDYHEVGAGADFLDPTDAVRGLRVAVELHFDFAGAPSEVANRAAGEGLDEVAEVTLGAELGC